MAFVYSCCFWFSLRLGGILIGLFSLGLVTLIVCCLGHSNSQMVKDELTNWINNYNLIYAKTYLENIQADPDKYLLLGICLSTIYIVVCIAFIYGAYMYNNMLMVMYLLMELLRLILISSLVATFLLLIKQNTMDIGMLIGASLAAGFLLLGMFYLWVCAANLPIVINEIERDEQAAVIDKLRKLLETNNQRKFPQGLDNIPFSTHPVVASRDIFTVTRNRDLISSRDFSGPSIILKPFNKLQ